ncbi:hypothetical protein WN51_12037 [Melipona quadrifasciata]|uniref:Uncharacterized protein n=1 Tax=Melipona quadrifasciata TaxID=166423 RepID=A0A0M9A235_9HYME|nr:hypothetical protein WN51_12037 [Melipona quadrifasciata]
MDNSALLRKKYEQISNVCVVVDGGGGSGGGSGGGGGGGSGGGSDGVENGAHAAREANIPDRFQTPNMRVNVFFVHGTTDVLYKAENRIKHLDIFELQHSEENGCALYSSLLSASLRMLRIVSAVSAHHRTAVRLGGLLRKRNEWIVFIGIIFNNINK